MPLNSLLTSEATTANDSTTVQNSVMELANKVSTMSSDELISWGISSVTTIVSKVVLAVVIYLVGKWLINRLVHFIQRAFEHRKIEISLSKFILSLVNISLSVMLIFTVIGVLGINTSSFLAIFASAGLAIGMALSGTLQNFAGGVLILFLKPFKVGDVIEAQGYTGTVKEISLFSTLVNTIDNKQVIIPNGSLSTSTINNYSKESTRRVEWTFGVAYGSDFDRVKGVILDVLSQHTLVMHDKEITVALSELASSSVNITVRVWCASADYWTLFNGVNELIYARFNRDGIEFPFPQMEVHLRNKQ